MKKILAIVGLVVCLVALYVTYITAAIKYDNERRKEEAALVQTCYKNNMVPVQTQAGSRCAKIENLVEIK